MNGGAPLDEDERRLVMLDDLIRQAREQERQETARKAEKAAVRAERERALDGHTLDHLESLRPESADQSPGGKLTCAPTPSKSCCGTASLAYRARSRL